MAQKEIEAQRLKYLMLSLNTWSHWGWRRIYRNGPRDAFQASALQQTFSDVDQHGEELTANLITLKN